MARIISINIPKSWLPAIDKLVGVKSIYVSRSELIRKAIDNALTKIIKEAKNNIPKKPIKSVTPAETEDDKLRRIVRESKERSKIRFNELENH